MSLVIKKPIGLFVYQTPYALQRKIVISLPHDARWLSCSGAFAAPLGLDQQNFTD
jgi:hypothetical protein